MFNLSIDSKLRGCDVVVLKVENIVGTDMPLSGQQCARRRPDGFATDDNSDKKCDNVALSDQSLFFLGQVPQNVWCTT
jgi:hypothetical protein